MIPLAAWPAALAVGLSLGLLGSGGSILTVPLLHEIVGLDMPSAVASSLPIVGLVAAGAMVSHARRGAVRLGRALPFAVASVAGAFAARALLAPLLAPRTAEVAFAALMLVVAWRMAFGRHPDAGDVERHPAAAAATGLVAGALTGVFGVGGGFLIVPALVLSLGLPPRQAVGTSLLVIALNCASSLLADRLGDGPGPRWDLVAVFSAVGIAGGVAGARVAHRLPQRVLRRTFAVAVVALAALLLVRG